MKTKHWLTLWGVMFIICALLGFIPAPQGFVKAVCVLAAAAFFVAPGALLQQFTEERNVKGLKVLALVAAFSLGATLVLLLGNVPAVYAADAETIPETEAVETEVTETTAEVIPDSAASILVESDPDTGISAPVLAFTLLIA